MLLVTFEVTPPPRDHCYYFPLPMGLKETLNYFLLSSIIVNLVLIWGGVVIYESESNPYILETLAIFNLGIPDIPGKNISVNISFLYTIEVQTWLNYKG